MKKERRLYRTGLILISRVAGLPEVINGKNFKIFFQERSEEVSDFAGQKEVVIEAGSITRAEIACELIICSMALWSGSPPISVRDVTVCPLGSREELPFKGNFDIFGTLDILTACLIAAKASFRTAYVNSIIKYYMSCDHHSNHWTDLTPATVLRIPLSPFPFDHFRYAYAIYIAFSVVEELKLAVNASSDKPSKINGKWNPVVKEDLERRLKEAGINIEEPMVWERRGPKRSLEARRPPNAVRKAPWAGGCIVRDCEVALIDAINDVGWLRSRIVAHKADKDIRIISVYDVSNAQHLARRLILESLGFWRTTE